MPEISPGFAIIVKLLKSVNQWQTCISRSDLKVAKRKALLFLEFKFRI